MRHDPPHIIPRSQGMDDDPRSLASRREGFERRTLPARHQSPIAAGCHAARRSRSAAQMRSFTRFSGARRLTTPISRASGGRFSSSSRSAAENVARPCRFDAIGDHAELLSRKATLNTVVPHCRVVDDMAIRQNSPPTVHKPLPRALPAIDRVLARHDVLHAGDRATNRPYVSRDAIPRVNQVGPQPPKHAALSRAGAPGSALSRLPIATAEMPAGETPPRAAHSAQPRNVQFKTIAHNWRRTDSDCFPVPARSNVGRI